MGSATSSTAQSIPFTRTLPLRRWKQYIYDDYEDIGNVCETLDFWRRVAREAELPGTKLFEVNRFTTAARTMSVIPESSVLIERVFAVRKPAHSKH